jgi:hypothetical protein
MLVLLAGCSEKEPKKEVMYKSGPYICEKWTGIRNTLADCINMSDMSEVKRIYNATNIIEIEVGK